ncbi:MAG: S46 family peptidase [Planctomycetota bacterium]|nr:S46 family peptidase [Planctomycetota bacterium]
MQRYVLVAFSALLLAAAAPAQNQPPRLEADNLALGKMWTFENPPLAYLEDEYGFKPDQKWLDSLRLGALRLGERDNPWCSASFVSPKGLIMTNHHCVRDQIATIQGPNDWVKDGFAATALRDEVPIPGLTVHQLIAQEDVTARVEAGIIAGDDPAAAANKRAANIQAIEAAADEAHPGHMHQVVALYHGAAHQLYRYRVWDDLRLVVAPHLQTAHYGGDPDNFTYPRWSIDFSFLRAYVDGAPAETAAHYFRWRQQGAEDGDLVFVPGNPGNTNRQLTLQQLELQRDLEYPMVVEQFANSIEILAPFKDRAPGLLTTLLSWQNSYKALKGMLDGLNDEGLMTKKRRNELHFRGAVSESAALGAKYGDLWREVNKLVQQQKELLPQVMFYQPGFSPVLQRGLLIAEALDESVGDARRDAARQQALNFAGGSSALTHQLLVDQFRRAARWLPRDDRLLEAVGGQHRDGGSMTVDWEAALAALRRSKLTRDAFVRDLLSAEDAAERWAAEPDRAGGLATDPGVRAARALWALKRRAEQRQEAVDAGLAEQGARLGRALFAVYGDDVSPDATMTLRFSDGRVCGYDYNGTVAPWATTFYGLYGRGASFGNEYPFDIPAPWLEQQGAIDLSARVCFASTNDIVGGNSGSCVVDQELRVVGLVFDGNIESLANDFYFSQDVPRAVSVHTDAIVQALQHVYGMGRVVEELRAGAGR